MGVTSETLRMAFGILVLVTILNIAVAAVTYGFLLRVRDRARDVEFWFMRTGHEEDEEDEDDD